MFKKYKKIFLFLYFFFLLIFLISLSLQRYFIGQLFYYDFGIFSQIIWRISRFSYPYISHLVLGKIHFLGDHFTPSLFLIAPIYWISSNIKILLIEQAIFTFFNTVLIYLIARKHKLSFFLSLIITSVFLIFSGTLYPLLTDWHVEPTAGFFLLLFYYFYFFTPKKLVSILSALIFLGFKESNSITFFFLLFYALFPLKEKRKMTIFLMILALIWFFLTTKMIIPKISKSFYLYTPEISLNPTRVVKGLIEKPEKLKLILNSFLSFGFIPLFSGMAIIPIIGELGIRVFPIQTIFENFTLTFHYNVYLGIFLTAATIITISKIKKIFKNNKSVELLILFFILFTSLITGRKITASPMNMMISPIFWKELRPNKEFFEFIDKIPKVGTVMSQNNILAYVSNRTDDLYFLKKTYSLIRPDVIALDFTPGQNPNNVYESEPENMMEILKSLLNDINYRLSYRQKNNRYIFRLKTKILMNNI